MWASEDEGFQRFLDRASEHPILTAQQERDLARRMRQGDRRAKHRLVECNFRLVLSIARHFYNKGLPKPDVVQEGVIGLHIAAEKFDPEKGFKFSTYATWWIRKAIQQGLSNSGADTIRLPPAIRQRRGLARSLLAKDPGLSMPELAAKMELSVDQVVEALQAAEVVVSVDDRVGDDDSVTMLETLSDPFDLEPHEALRETNYPRLMELLDELPRLQRSVLRLRFGLIPGRPPMTINAIAAVMHKQPHTIQLAQKRGLDHLRARLAEVDSD